MIQDIWKCSDLSMFSESGIGESHTQCLMERELEDVSKFHQVCKSQRNDKPSLSIKFKRFFSKFEKNYEQWEIDLKNNEFVQMNRCKQK